MAPRHRPTSSLAMNAKWRPSMRIRNEDGCRPFLAHYISRYRVTLLAATNSTRSLLRLRACIDIYKAALRPARSASAGRTMVATASDRSVPHLPPQKSRRSLRVPRFAGRAVPLGLLRDSRHFCFSFVRFFHRVYVPRHHRHAFCTALCAYRCA